MQLSILQKIAFDLKSKRSTIKFNATLRLIRFLSVCAFPERLLTSAWQNCRVYNFLLLPVLDCYRSMQTRTYKRCREKDANARETRRKKGKKRKKERKKGSYGYRWMRSQRDEHVLQVKPTRTSVNRMNASKTVAFEAFTRESVRTCSSITIAPDDDAGSHVFSL